MAKTFKMLRHGRVYLFYFEKYNGNVIYCGWLDVVGCVIYAPVWAQHMRRYVLKSRVAEACQFTVYLCVYTVFHTIIYNECNKRANVNMPKSLKKSCSSQTSISRYFGGLSSSSVSNTPNPAEHQLSRRKVKCAWFSALDKHSHIRSDLLYLSANYATESDSFFCFFLLSAAKVFLSWRFWIANKTSQAFPARPASRGCGLWYCILSEH